MICLQNKLLRLHGCQAASVFTFRSGIPATKINLQSNNQPPLSIYRWTFFLFRSSGCIQYPNSGVLLSVFSSISFTRANGTMSNPMIPKFQFRHQTNRSQCHCRYKYRQISTAVPSIFCVLPLHDFLQTQAIMDKVAPEDMECR